MNLLMNEQDSAASGALVQRLIAAGFRPDVVRTGGEALHSAMREGAAAVLLDLGQAAPPAQATIAALRRGGMAQPLLVLSARDDWRERVASFEAGADDYLLKPAHSEEVAARLRAAIRRAIGAASDRIALGDIDVDIKGQCAWRAGRCLELTRNEFRLLRLFITATNGVVTKDDIAHAVWPGRADTPHNAIEVLIGRLRAKLGGNRIRTVRGVGYRLMTAEAGADLLTEPCTAR